jgi:hypothetical protein
LDGDAQFCDTLGSFTDTFTDPNSTRGNFVLVDQPEDLKEILMELDFTGSADIAFVVYESPTLESGLWNLVYQNVLTIEGTGQDYYSSGPISVALAPETYYYIGTAWEPSITFGLDPMASPLPFSQGTVVAGGGQSSISVPLSDPQNLIVEDDIYSMELCFSVLPCPPLFVYDVYLGTDTNSMELICNNISEPNCDPNLECNTMYYWKAVAKNCCGRITCPIWSFTTGLDGDLSDNLFVDFIDYAAFADQWMNQDCISPHGCNGADINDDGKVDMLDLDILIMYWLQECLHD